MTRLILTTIISFALSFSIWLKSETYTVYENKTPKEWMKNSANIGTPKEHIRPGDQTFLTFPEWFLVHSPAEEAEYLKKRTSTTFPFWGHVEQLWKSYYIVYDQIKENYDFNVGYHVMILVIATSTTAEYGAKAVYETMIGRITDTRIGAELTEEDRLQAEVTLDYVNFIRQTPWYEFDFGTPLEKLWLRTPLIGSHMFRKWERRYFLTSDLAVKFFYGWIIKKATKAAYVDPILGTAVVVDNPLEGNEKISPLNDLSSHRFAYLFPRYADFNPTLNYLVNQDFNLLEIAGNTSAILVTLIISESDSVLLSEDSKILFSQKILTRPGEKRIAIVTTIPNLKSTLVQLREKNLIIEHIYDF